jgi:hypothetical protein
MWFCWNRSFFVSESEETRDAPGTCMYVIGHPENKECYQTSSRAIEVTRIRWRKNETRF